ncbi:MAG: ATP12 family protein [Pseudomonadota bacterium]
MTEQGSSAPKRFYAKAFVEPAENGFAVLLDGRTARTRRGAPLGGASRRLVDAVAAEWEAQGARIEPQTMPLTRLLSTSIDLGEAESDKWRARVAAFLKADALCYRADAPAELAARQASVWDPYIDWAGELFGGRLLVTTGVGFVAQPTEILAKAQETLDSASPDEALSLRILAETTGSGVLALARWRGAFDADAIYAASRLDEAFQIEKWGEDAEAKARDARVRADYDAAGRFLDLQSASG